MSVHMLGLPQVNLYFGQFLVGGGGKPRGQSLSCIDIHGNEMWQDNNKWGQSKNTVVYVFGPRLIGATRQPVNASTSDLKRSVPSINPLFNANRIS
jgi:hypothetical protein